MQEKINATLEQAKKHLDNAKEELYKPEEDIVPYSICKFSHGAIVDYLSAFLMKQGRVLPAKHSVEELLSYCREVDPKFDELHLSPFYHPTATEDIWMNPDTAQDFLKMAERTHELVLELSHESN